MSKSSVVFTSTTFLLGNILVAIFILPIIKKLGIRWTLVGSAILACMGTAVRLLADSWFYYILFGQLMLGIAACFIVNIIMQFCYTWFSPQTRPIYLSVGSIMNIFGGGIGNSLSLIFLNDTETDIDVIRSGFHTYNYFMFGVMSVLALLTLIFLREKPPRGYGYTDAQPLEEDEDLEQGNFLKQNWVLLKFSLSFPLFRSYLWIYIFANSCLVFMGSVINMILGYFDYKSVS